MDRLKNSAARFVFMLLASAVCLPAAYAKDTALPPLDSTVALKLLSTSDHDHTTTIETLLKTSESWDGTPYAAYPPGTPEITMLKIVIPPRTALPWHTHPMPNAAYVVSGELTVETKDGKTQQLKPGQVLPETVGIVHRGTSGDEEVTLIVFYAGVQGMKLNELAH